MPSATYLKNNFILGEINPQAKGRYQSEQYDAAADYLKNWLPEIEGGLIPRMGSKFVAEAIDSDQPTALIPYELTDLGFSDQFMLEMGDGEVRLYHPASAPSVGGAYTYTETVSGNALIQAAPAREANVLQINNRLFMAHNKWASPRIIRWSPVLLITADSVGYPTSFTTQQARLKNFLNEDEFSSTEVQRGPFNDAGHTGLTLTPSGVGSGSITYTASDDIFSEFDIGRQIWYLDNSNIWHTLIIDGYSAADTITATSMDTATAGALTAVQSWALELSELPDQANGQGRGPRAIGIYQDRLVLAGWESSPSKIAFSEIGNWSNFEPRDRATGNIAASYPFTVELADLRFNMICWVRGTEDGVLVGTTGQEWVIRSPSSTDGALDATNTPVVEARVISNIGSSYNRPVSANADATIFVSQGEKHLHEIYRDGNALKTRRITRLSDKMFSPGIGQIAIEKSPVRRIWSTLSRVNKALDYSQPNFKNHKTEAIAALYESGADNIFGPARVALGGVGDPAGGSPVIESIAVKQTIPSDRDEIWMVVRRYVDGAFTRTVERLASPLTPDMDIEQACLLDCAYSMTDKVEIVSITKANPAVVELNVASDSFHPFANSDKVRFENIAGMTELNGNEYTLANKATNGDGRVTFELSGTDSSAYGTFQESDTGIMKKIINGVSSLSHLEGETLSVVADGQVLDDVEVSSGAVSLGDYYADVHIGYGYNSDGRLLRPDVGSAIGTALGKTMRCHRVSMHLERTVNLKVGKDFDNLAELRSGQTDEFSGIVSESVDVDYELGNRVCFRRDQPLPAHILAVALHLFTQDR